MYKLHQGDCLQVLPWLNVMADAAITEPPFCAHAVGKPHLDAENLSRYSDWMLEVLYQVSYATRLGGFIAIVASRMDAWYWHDYFPPGFDIFPVEYCAAEPHGIKLMNWVPFVYWVNSPETMAYYLDARPERIAIPKLAQIAANPRPLTVWERAIKKFTQPDSGIIDPFTGHGGIGVSALKLGRNYIGIELDPERCKTTQHRLSEV